MIIHKPSFVVDDETGATFWPTNAGACFDATNARFRVAGVDLSVYASADNRYKLVAKDTALKKAEGFIDVADSAEALGSEVITNGDCETAAASLDDDTTGGIGSYAQDDASGDSGPHGGSNAAKVTRIAAGAGNTIYWFRDSDLSKVTALNMYFVSVWVYLPSGQTLSKIRLGLDGGIDVSYPAETATTDIWVELTGYIIPQTDIEISLGYTDGLQNEYFYIDDFTLKPITHVGEDGVLIMSTKGGSTQSWALQESGIDLNDIATFEVQRATRHHSL